MSALGSSRKELIEVARLMEIHIEEALSFDDIANLVVLFPLPAISAKPIAIGSVAHQAANDIFSSTILGQRTMPRRRRYCRDYRHCRLRPTMALADNSMSQSS